MAGSIHFKPDWIQKRSGGFRRSFRRVSGRHASMLAVLFLVVGPHFLKEVVGVAVVSQGIRSEVAAHFGGDLQLQGHLVSCWRLGQIPHGFGGLGRFALARWLLKGADIGHQAALLLEIFSIALTMLWTTLSARWFR